MISKTKAKIKAIAIAVALMACAPAVAQEEQGELKSYNFVEVQGGIQLTATDAKTDMLITPTVSLSLGRYFTPAVGLRLHVNGAWAKGGFGSNEPKRTYYDWNYITTDVDVLLNLTNIFSEKKDRPLNIILLGGIGLNTMWGNDEALDIAEAYGTDVNMPYAWDGTKLSHNLRAGIRVESNVTKKWGLSFEVDANSLNDKFNSKYNNSDDWSFTATIGVSYRWGHKYETVSKPEPLPEPIVEPEPVVEPEPEPVVEPEPEPVVVEPEKIHEEAFYKIRESDSDRSAQMKRIAEYLKRNPDAKISVTGYADKGTGTSELNKKYAQQRADNFKETLVDDYGVDASRIITDSKGDTVQPFSENDKNRCVIIEGPVN